MIFSINFLISMLIIQQKNKKTIEKRSIQSIFLKFFYFSQKKLLKSIKI